LQSGSIQRGANIDSRNDKEETPLDHAAGDGFLDISRFLVGSSASVFSRDNKGWTPLHTTSKCGHLHIAKFLLERGVLVNVRNGKEGTSLDLASSGGKLDVVDFLIENGADIHAEDSNGWNPVQIASQNGHVDVVRLLTRAGVPVDDLRNGAQKTPLALASGKGKADVARGPSPNRPRSEGKRHGRQRLDSVTHSTARWTPRRCDL
jgi:ankyrin repeat protein